MKQNTECTIGIAAGGTGGHIFPALSVAMALRTFNSAVSLVWFGTFRNREKELCAEHTIPFYGLRTSGMTRKPSLKMIVTLYQFVRAFLEARRVLHQKHIAAVIAFGGYVTAPVLAAARMRGTPIFTHEQNTVPGIVNKWFASKTVINFLGMPVEKALLPRGNNVLVGMPVRIKKEQYIGFTYPANFQKGMKTILICGGSQGALSMNRALMGSVHKWLSEGLQVVWQTGKAGFREAREATEQYDTAFVFESMPDLYPWYAVAHLVVGRAGASTIAETAYFHLPCILIPLPWATENHQLKNAHIVAEQGWGKCVEQNEDCGVKTEEAVKEIVHTPEIYERMKEKATMHSPRNAARNIAEKIHAALGITVS